tara:strand:+ start:22632 stop:23396 length:765 start_codon:yes stop_codon:yes gene_type:complete
MKNICIIPARMGSSRFPGKPLYKISGKALIHHVYDNCKKSKLFKKIIVATPDKEIKEFCININAEYIMTSNEHKRASDRCNEAILKLEKTSEYFDIVTMVQGDEPLVSSEVIDKITNALRIDKNVKCANGFGNIEVSELRNKNCIKVLKDINDNAIYMSREPIPHNAKINVNVGKQVCVIPFRSDFLKLYSKLEATPLEIAESIDMLRIIENNYKVKMVNVEGYFQPVDVIEDVNLVEKFLLRKFKNQVLNDAT